MASTSDGAEPAPEMLVVPVSDADRLPAGTRCGIHGLLTHTGRCAACDGDRTVDHVHAGRSWGKIDLGAGMECSFTHCTDPLPVGADALAEPELPADPTGVDCWERYESPADQA